MNIRIVLLVCISCLMMHTSKAQSPQCQLILSGRIVDAATGLGVAHAQVLLREQQKTTQADSLGYFTLRDLCAGNLTLTTKHLNHEEKTEKIQLKTSLRNKIIYLTCHADTLHEVKIKRSKIHWEDVTVSNRIQGNDLFLSSGLSLGKALEKVNGVYSLSTGNAISKPVIRGMHSNRVLILNNGIRQEGQQWGNEHAPEIDPFMAKDIEVVKGAQSIRYGSDIIGGVILVNPKAMKDIAQGIQGEWNTALFRNGRSANTALMLEGRPQSIPGLSWRLQGSAKRSGNTQTPDYFLKNTGVKELNYSLSLAWQNAKQGLEVYHSYFSTDIGIFAGSHIGNLTDLYNAFEADCPLDSAGFSYTIAFPYQHIQHRLLKAVAWRQISPHAQLKFIYGLQQNRRQEFDKTLQTKKPDGTYEPALDFLLVTHHADLSLKHQWHKRIEGEIGLNGFFQTNRYFGNYFIPNVRKLQGGLFWVEKWHRNALSAEAGVRYDINTFQIWKWEQQTLISPSHSFHGPAATLAFRYQLPLLTLHLSMGTAWRAPYVNELYSDGVHHSAASYEIGDRRLTSERSYNTSFTVDINRKQFLDMEITGFYNYIKNYINLQPVMPATLTIRGAFPTFRYTQINALFSGIEMSASLKVYKDIRWNVKGNLTQAKDISNKKFIVGIPPARIETDLELPLYQRKGNELHWVSGISYTFRQNRVADSADYVPAPPAYLLCHTDLHSTWKLGRIKMLADVGVNNLLNTRYRDYMNRNRYFADELGRNVYVRFTFPFVLKS
ncbi:MAG: TonB-dependent receptor [Chitinophagaceae bacterium]|nr:TonB-dependent receptor [Chitinophagaceae bacterium]